MLEFIQFSLASVTPQEYTYFPSEMTGRGSREIGLITLIKNLGWAFCVDVLRGTEGCSLWPVRADLCPVWGSNGGCKLTQGTTLLTQPGLVSQREIRLQHRSLRYRTDFVPRCSVSLTREPCPRLLSYIQTGFLDARSDVLMASLVRGSLQ